MQFLHESGYFHPKDTLAVAFFFLHENGEVKASQRAYKEVEKMILQKASAVYLSDFHPVHREDVDRFGHVNHARIVAYLEWGRGQWCERNGWSLEEDIFPVVERLDISYLREVKLDSYAVETSAPEHMLDGEDTFLRYRIPLQQQLWVTPAGHAKPLLAARATVHLAFVYRESRSLASVGDFVTQFDGFVP